MSIKIIKDGFYKNSHTDIKHSISNYKIKFCINKSLKDLTNLKTYSIDDNYTREIDDAISLERISNNFKLWIHIASPASNIEYDSDLDRNARKLISSVYLSSNNYYMLPEKFIDEVLSLKKNQIRPSLSLGVTIDNDGNITSTEIVESLIKSNYQLNYEEADELIDYAPKEEEDLSIISNILKKRLNRRKINGATEIRESYGKIIVENDIPNIKLIEPTISRLLVSEAMILYGYLISKFTQENNISVPYRVQEPNNKITKIKTNIIGNNILHNFLIKKNMGKSYYSIEPLRHYGLGLESYLQATSPIRRYSDLLVHYQLHRYLNNRALISKEDIESNIPKINTLSKQNITRFREDQQIWLKEWFKLNSINEYDVVLLNCINKYKNISIIYFIDHCISSICYLITKVELNIGDKIRIKNITNNYNDLLYFQLIA